MASLVASETRKPSVLLCTAIMKVMNSFRVLVPFRALLDCASEATFVTNRCVEKPGLRKIRSNVSIGGITGSSTSTLRVAVDLQFQAFGLCSKIFNIRAIVVPKVTANVPRHDISDSHQWSHLRDLRLADPIQSCRFR